MQCFSSITANLQKCELHQGHRRNTRRCHLWPDRVQIHPDSKQTIDTPQPPTVLMPVENCPRTSRKTPLQRNAIACVPQFCPKFEQKKPHETTSRGSQVSSGVAWTLSTRRTLSSNGHWIHSLSLKSFLWTTSKRFIISRKCTGCISRKSVSQP